MRRMKISRKIRSQACANIILDCGLMDEFIVYRYNHPKIKSLYRLANLFLLNKKKRYLVPSRIIDGLDMSNLFDYYYA